MSHLPSTFKGKKKKRCKRCNHTTPTTLLKMKGLVAKTVSVNVTKGTRQVRDHSQLCQSETMSRRAVIAFIRQTGIAEGRKHASECTPPLQVGKLSTEAVFCFQHSQKGQLLVPEVMISAFRLSKKGQRLNYLKLPLQFGSLTHFPVIEGFFQL